MALVAALIAILGALVAPSLKGMFGYYKLNGAVDGVRAAWADSRTRAVAEGRPYRFSVVPGTGMYRVAPDQPDYWGGAAPAFDPAHPALVEEKALPRGVTFSGNGAGPAGAADASPVGPAHVSPDAYTTLAVFLPDGTARADVEILFQVRGARPTTLCLRSLTGATAVRSDPAGGGR